MDYLKEVEAFFDEVDVTLLSWKAVTLWHTLMHFKFRSGEKKELLLSDRLLRWKTRLSEKDFNQAREELKEKGYLLYKGDRKYQSAIYEMISRISPRSM
ncbi:hypothetical protein [Halobacillus sp. Marseille-Q1614]|uniref:hypothetical protein n=1 Tax=Halobacillus sp. Marseille-Q1614 TaxID=2709134 RepID=UPI00156F9FA5|nr:hypothetical protein [Halobacillus sp. Marseille-Q1614]